MIRYRRRKHRRKRSFVSKQPWQANLALSFGSLLVVYFNADVVSFVILQISEIVRLEGGVFNAAQIFTLPLTALCTFGAGMIALVTAFHGATGLCRSVFARLGSRRRMGKALQMARLDGCLQGLSWRSFEYLVGQYFKDQGYAVEIGGGVQDGGVDVHARDKTGRKILIQCKHWKSTSVGATVVREMIGAIKLHGADGGVIVCSDRFTRNAHEEAVQLGIRLIEGQELMRYVASSKVSHVKVS